MMNWLFGPSDWSRADVSFAITMGVVIGMGKPFWYPFVVGLAWCIIVATIKTVIRK